MRVLLFLLLAMIFLNCGTTLQTTEVVTSQATAELSLPNGWEFNPQEEISFYYLQYGRYETFLDSSVITDTLSVISGDTVNLEFSWRQPPTFSSRTSQIEISPVGNVNLTTLQLSANEVTYTALDTVFYEHHIPLKEGIYIFRVASVHNTRGASKYSDAVHILVKYDELNPPSQPIYFRVKFY